MLQQTRVETVIPYYARFLARFPDVASLARAESDALLGAWAGLGYYSRARNLQRAAQAIVAEHAGCVPDTAERLRALPGIGRYTAGAVASIAFDRAKNQIQLEADDDFKMKAVVDVLNGKMVKRGVPVKNLKMGEIQPAAGGKVRREITLTQGIPTDTAKEIVKSVKAQNFKKIQVAIQGEELRVSGPSKDDLQAVMAFLRTRDFGLELKFGNYR